MDGSAIFSVDLKGKSVYKASCKIKNAKPIMGEVDGTVPIISRTELATRSSELSKANIMDY